VFPLSFFKTFFLLLGGGSHKPLLWHLGFKTPLVKQLADVHFMAPDSSPHLDEIHYLPKVPPVGVGVGGDSIFQHLPVSS
jgi:hypothetical protein